MLDSLDRNELNELLEWAGKGGKEEERQAVFSTEEAARSAANALPKDRVKVEQKDILVKVTRPADPALAERVKKVLALNKPPAR